MICWKKLFTRSSKEVQASFQRIENNTTTLCMFIQKSCWFDLKSMRLLKGHEETCTVNINILPSLKQLKNDVKCTVARNVQNTKCIQNVIQNLLLFYLTVTCVWSQSSFFYPEILASTIVVFAVQALYFTVPPYSLYMLQFISWTVYRASTKNGLPKQHCVTSVKIALGKARLGLRVGEQKKKEYNNMWQIKMGIKTIISDYMKNSP